MAGNKKPKAKGGKRPGSGRKTGQNKWTDMEMVDKLEIVEGWARDGATDSEMIEALGIARQTFYTWKKKYPEFAAALKRGKEVIDRQVETALFKRAVGYKTEEITHERQYNHVTEEWEFVEVKRVIKEVNPDAVSAIFWLKNRKPKEWRDKQEIEHSGEMAITFVDDLND